MKAIDSFLKPKHMLQAVLLLLLRASALIGIAALDTVECCSTGVEVTYDFSINTWLKAASSRSKILSYY